MNTTNTSKSKDKKTIFTLSISIQTPQHSFLMHVPAPCPISTFKHLLAQAIPSIIQKIAYLQTIDSNWLTDYKLQSGSGWLRNDCKLRCVMVKNDNEILKGMEKYILLKCVGVGGFSKVYLSRSRIDGTFYAAKFIEKSKIKEKLHLIINQKKVNQQTDFPFLVRMREFIELAQFYVMILDYCPGGELFNLQRRLHRFEEDAAKKYFIEVMLAIEYLHSKSIIYRDLKPENIMLDVEGHLRIADFGLAKFTKQKRYSFCGSLEYMSPEVVSRNGHSFEVDYYCMGALLYEMVVGCPPFYEPNISETQTKYRILHEDVYFPQQLELSEQIKNLIKALLQKDPSKRLGHLGGVKQIKCHPWIGWINRKDYLDKKIEMPYPVDLDCFNFDSKDITLSAQRVLRKMSNPKKNEGESLKKLKQKVASPFGRGSVKDLHRFKSHSSLPHKVNCTPSHDKKQNPSKQKSILNKLKRSGSKQKIKKERLTSIRDCYLSHFNNTLGMSKYLRLQTQNGEQKSKPKERKTYIKQQTEGAENDRQRQHDGLKKKRNKRQHIFKAIKRC